MPSEELRKAAEEMLSIVFDGDATEDEVDSAATTLVDIVAPQILNDSILGLSETPEGCLAALNQILERIKASGFVVLYGKFPLKGSSCRILTEHKLPP